MKKLPWTDVFKKYKIFSKRVRKDLPVLYEEPEKFEEEVAIRPYEMLIEVVGKNFKKADELVLELYPQFKDSHSRCKWIVWSMLKDVESEGDTCINANVLARALKQDYAEVYDHVVDVVKNNELFYYDPTGKMVAIRDTYEAEKRIAEEIKKRVINPVKYDIDWQKYTAVDGIALTEEQSQILKLACKESVMMLNGGAGCGKSSTTKSLLTMLDKEGYSFTALAPTGIAAKRIKESSGYDASTIHKFLFSKKGIGDYLVLDEAGMIGVHLMSALFKRLNDDTKIVIICDEAQLCSISCGNIVQDIINSDIVPTVKLTKVFRYGKGGIATVATDVRNGKKLTDKPEFNDYRFIPTNKDTFETVLNVYDGLLKTYKREDILVLSPFNVRSTGTFAINKAIQERYNGEADVLASYNKQKDVTIEFRKGDRIINTENSYKMRGENGNIAVMNGEYGTVLGLEEDGLLKVEFENGVALLEQEEIWKQLLGYCITCHKSQGCQGKAVIVVLDKNAGFFLTRNLIYMALTRAQEKLIVVGDLRTINSAIGIEENKTRNTWLKELLSE